MEYMIPPELDGILLRDFLRSLPAVSGGILTELKRTEDGITVNGRRENVRLILHAGDTVCINYAENAKSDIEPVDLPLDIIYEDRDMIAVNKPSGMPTHPSHGHHYDTLANALSYYYKESGFVCRVINRLDSFTSGVVLAAKNRPAAYMLSELMRRGGFQKTYYALCSGYIKDDSGRIEKNIKRKEESVIFREVCGENEGKTAITEYKVLYRDGDKTIVKLTPSTGRTHQLRVHMAYIGAPISGDGLYGDGEGEPGLHAYSLEFTDPLTGKPLKLTAPLPEIFGRIKTTDG